MRATATAMAFWSRRSFFGVPLNVNVSFGGDKLIRHGRIHIGVAVALPDGLIVPVLRDADTLTVTQISAQTRDLAGRARTGKLKPEEFTGSTFSISNPISSISPIARQVITK